MNKLNEEQLKNKYGNKKILVIKNENIYKSLKIDDFKNNFYSCTDYNKLRAIFMNKEYMLRYKAENDNNYKQPIPYVIFQKENTDMFFCMKRISGDIRLVGRKSLGVGGHIDNNENLESALYREIHEEVGLNRNDIIKIDFLGYILDESNDVGSVHLGLLFIAKIDSNRDMHCLEKDTLNGYFVSKNGLLESLQNKEFETWSEIAINQIIGE